MAFQIRSAAALLLVFVFTAAYQVDKSVGATTYVVGGSLGWTIPPGGADSYASWASGLTFHPGDVLVFNFPTGVHDVAKVDKAAFDSCTASNPASLATVGPATATLTSAVDQYFICTFGQHCSFGQKLTLKVSGASTSPPAPSPNATTSSPPPTTAAPPPTATKPLAPPPSTTTSSPPPEGSASTPQATPSTTPSSSPPTASAAAPKSATPSTTTPPAKSPASASMAPSTSATPPANSPASAPLSPPTSSSPAPAPTAGGPEAPSSSLSPQSSAPGPSTTSPPPPSGSATTTTHSTTLMGFIVAIAGGIVFVCY